MTIFLLLANNTERRKDAIEDWQRLGILDSDIFEWKITVNNPFYKYIWSNPNLPAEKWWLNITNALNCTLDHYEIMLQSLALGYKKVLILEDDARFLKDISKIEYILNFMPNDYDICLLDKFSPMPKNLYINAIKNHKINDEFFCYDTVKLWSCACYALSEKAMQSITYQQNNKWQPADSVTNIVDNFGKPIKRDGLVRLAPITNIAVQDQHYKNYKTQQEYNIDCIIYENIADKSLYNVKIVNPPVFN